MNEELEFIFNTRHSSDYNADFYTRIANAVANDFDSSDYNADFYTRIANAVANDLERERAAEETGELEEDDPFENEDDDKDVDYIPNKNDASDVENDLVIEPNIEPDTDQDEEECDSLIDERNATDNIFF
ncbi:hypothetical protein QE152_g40185 [Popillia japonica]|uniref:Uncharacterized protein n=1 Tax=Popillia japonica TaxID=7064 RepID=A0AAW1HRT0_POPJA